MFNPIFKYAIIYSKIYAPLGAELERTYDDDDDEWFLLKKDLMINLACTFLKSSIFNQTST